MKWKEAYNEMLKRKKVRRKGWAGYWYLDRFHEIKIVFRYFKDKDYGELKEILLTSTLDIVETLSHTLFDDWEVVE